MFRTALGRFGQGSAHSPLGQDQEVTSGTPTLVSWVRVVRVLRPSLHLGFRKERQQRLYVAVTSNP